MASNFAIPGISRHSSGFSRKLNYRFSLVLIDLSDRMKRVMDIVFAVMLLMLMAPVMIWLTLQRRFRGQVAFTRGQRVGWLGRQFRQYGFSGLDRSNILRNLPALFNILRGDMSFIGPRAAAPEEGVRGSDGGGRVTIRPGLICYWWLRKRGNIDFDDEASVDRQYLNRASLTRDLGIALRAIPALAFGERRDVAPRTVDILGIRIDNLNMTEALDWIAHKLNSEGQAMVCMTNAHCANVSCLDPAYYQALQSAGLNLADGVGIRIAGKLKSTPIRQNVNGTDLFPRLCALLQGTDKGIYLLGGLPGVPEGVARWITGHFPDTSIAGCRNGYFKPEDEPEIARAIRDSGASILFVAMGVPHQELWIQRNLGKTGVRVALAVGGLFDFYSGRIPRAPEWMREVGIEWTYRLIQEPGRMWRRYLIGNWTFLVRFLLYEWKYYHPPSHRLGGKYESDLASSGQPVMLRKPD
jgi:N-acetylglucosaminyldiphosphoundecaprenol N-acetyl-beta-D-mannosaminyltransferase